MMALPALDLTGVAIALTASALAYILLTVIYNLYFHPLSRFPGPLAYRATRFAYLYRMYRGTFTRDLLGFYDQYGPVVRIAPNELAFNHPDAWRDIYGHKAVEIPKHKAFYSPRGVPPNIITEDHANHAVLRRRLAPQFSDRSMREQEPLITKYVNLLIERLHEFAIDPDRKDEQTGMAKKRALDMVSWYTWTTFDIIGDLAFGEPFGCLERARDDPWVKAVFDTVDKSPIMLAMNLLGLDRLLLPVVKYFMKGRRLHEARTSEKLERRMALNVERPDLIEGLLKKGVKDGWEIDIDRLRVNAGVLIVAGSETTSTLLSGVTYLLLRNPETLKRLTEEVRSSFQSEEEITFQSVNGLHYMLACLNEALRCYSPVPVGLPRFIPKGYGGATIAGEVVPDGTAVSVWHWPSYHSEDNFLEPFSYRPERFLQDPKFANDKFDMLQPFSVGPRNCVGRNLSYAEMRLILAKVIYNFDMELVDPEIEWFDQKAYVLYAKPPLQVYLTPVKR